MRRVWLWIVIAAGVGVMPTVFFGNAWGHDFDFHLPLWIEVSHQFHLGTIYPRWASGANAGFGEPSLMFYPPLSWMTGGLMGSVLPWRWVPCAYLFLVLILSGISMWRLASDWLGPKDAMMATLLYAWNPYLMVMAYKRCSYGELLASAFFPLLVWAAIRTERDGRRIVLPLVFIFCAIWLSDLPAGVIASYSLALLLVLNSLLHRSWRPLLYGTVAIVAAFGSMAFFLLPAAWERQWVEIGVALRPAWMPETNFLFTPNGDAVMSLMNKWLSLIAVALMATMGVAALIIRRKRLKPQPNDAWYLLAALGAAASFLMLRASSLVWQILPALRYAEYPWRWLTPLAVAATLLTAAAVAELPRKKLWWTAAGVTVTAISGVLIYTVRWDTGNHQLAAMVAAADSGAGYRIDEDKDWCVPLGSHTSRLAGSAPLVTSSENAPDFKVDIRQWLPERKIFSVNSHRAVLLKIKLLNYRAWQATINGENVTLQTDPGTGQMLLPDTVGPAQVEIQFGRTPDRGIAIAVSVVSILLLALFSVKYRRPQPSPDDQ